MIKQTYQEVSKVILEELLLNPMDFKKKDYHKYFYNLKMENPEKYERLTFDTNGHTPFSGDLGSIFSDFINCGFMDFDHNIILKSLPKIEEHIYSE